MIDFSLPLAVVADGESASFSTFISFVTEHWRFCLLHFLEFAIWGAWFVVLGNLLNARGFSRKEIGRIYGTMPIGSMITPLFIGPLADRLVNTEVLIGISHLIGAVLLFMMARARNARPFYWFAFFYALAYSPTLGLVNSIVFAHDSDIFNGMAQQGFPWIRVFGTIGWIAAGLSHAILLKKGEPVNERPLLLACALSIALGLFAFTLPATPPAALAPAVAEVTETGEVADDGPGVVDTAEATQTDSSDSDETASATTDATENVASTANADDAAADTTETTTAASNMGIIEGSMEMLGRAPIFFAVTFIAAIAMGLYFAFAALFLEKTGVPANTVGPVMTIGQWIEIFFMLTLPWFLGPGNARMNIILLVGVSAWAVRFGLFAIGRPLALVLAGIAIHGICFDFFFAAGFINADVIAPEGLTATAQTFYGFLVYGLGMYIGSEGSGWLNQYFSKTTVDDEGKEQVVTNWRGFWAIPCVILSIAAVLFWLSIAGS